jgi:hypothetical protein
MGPRQRCGASVADDVATICNCCCCLSDETEERDIIFGQILAMTATEI